MITDHCFNLYIFVPFLQTLRQRSLLILRYALFSQLLITVYAQRKTEERAL